MAQTEASVWYSNGVHTSMYKRPEDHCCHIYLGSKFTEEEDEPLCYEKGAKQPGIQKEYGYGEKFIKGIDCGKNTWIELYNAPKHKKRLSLAGK